MRKLFIVNHDHVYGNVFKRQRCFCNPLCPYVDPSVVNALHLGSNLI